MTHTTKRRLINSLTMIRLFFIPLFYFIEGVPAFLLLNFLFITDFLDGYLARKYGVTSNLGAILDLIGDKSLTIFLLIVYTGRGKLSLVVSSLLIIREVYSIVMRFYYLRKSDKLIKASLLGKIKTTLFFVSFDMLILNIYGYRIMFIIILIISYYSIFTYIREGIKK